MVELTDQQQRELRLKHEYPLRVLNSGTQETFFLLPAELYERVRAILEEEDEISSIEEMYPLLTEVLDQEPPSARESA